MTEERTQEERSRDAELSQCWSFDSAIRPALSSLDAASIAKFRKAARLQDQRGGQEEAANLYRELIRERSEFFAPYVSLAALLGLKGQIAEAEQLLRKAVEIEPTYANAHYFLALCLRDQGYAKKAAVEFRTALKTGLKSNRLYARLWLVWHGLGFKYKGQRDE